MVRGPMKRVCVLLPTLLLLHAAESRAAAAMALLPTSTQGVADDVGPRVDKVLERAARSHGGYTVLTANDMIPKLGEAQSLGIQCGAKDAECLIKLGILLEIDQLVATTVTTASERYAIEALWIDARGGREVGRVRSLVDKSGNSFETGVSDVVTALLDSSVPPARLAVTVSEPGAQVRIDGNTVGTTPLTAPVTDLAPGPHKVTVEKAGMRTVERDILLAAGVPMALDIVMAPVGVDAAASGGGGGGKAVLFWSGASALGLGAIGAAGGITGAMLMNGALLDPALPVEERYGARTTGQTLAFVAATSIVVAAIGAGLLGLSFAVGP